MSASLRKDPDRTLLLMRHAKSAWPPGVTDPQRPLNDRGRRDAPVAGRWIASTVGIPDLIICSPAIRTRETADLVVSTWQHPSHIVYDDRVYEAHWTELAAIVTGLPDEARTVLLIGHNPGLEDFAASWPDSADAKASQVLGDKFPTSSIALVDVTGTWRDTQAMRLREIAIPRG